jgi:copper chaperone
MQRASLLIEGMTCGHCVRAVERVLNGLAGVHSVRVNVGSAIVAYDPSVVSPQGIEAAVLEEGYAVLSLGAAG